MRAEDFPHAPDATEVPRLLDQPAPDRPRATGALVAHFIRHRARYGISRIGCVTRLDRVGLPVVQVVRPLALSNAVVQGKGLTLEDAAASALMEALETWAAERPPAPARHACAAALGEAVEGLYAGAVAAEAGPDWAARPITWLTGWDLVAKRAVPVPLALVDTAYTVPSPHPPLFPRTTSGLGAGSSMAEAVLHGLLELLERHAVADARRRPRFFDDRQVDPARVAGPLASRVLERAGEGGLAVGAWLVPAPHGLPIYWCHVMERPAPLELLALPAEGFACGFSHDGAMARALLEACQGRVTAISGARDDVVRDHYPEHVDRRELDAWREALVHPPRTLEGTGGDAPEPAREAALPRAVDAALAAGARAAIVVPLHADEASRLFVARVVAPPLDPGAPT